MKQFLAILLITLFMAACDDSGSTPGPDPEDDGNNRQNQTTTQKNGVDTGIIRSDIVHDSLSVSGQ